MLKIRAETTRTPAATRSERATLCWCASSLCWVTAWGAAEESEMFCGSPPKRCVHTLATRVSMHSCKTLGHVSWHSARRSLNFFFFLKLLGFFFFLRRLRGLRVFFPHSCAPSALRLRIKIDFHRICSQPPMMSKRMWLLARADEFASDLCPCSDETNVRPKYVFMHVRVLWCYTTDLVVQISDVL